MTDDVPKNLVLRYLRRIDDKVDLLGERMDDFAVRLSAVEVGLNGVRRDLVSLYEAGVRLQVSFDRQGARLDRIERRLNLNET
jgi:hypothetical protein